MCIILLIYDKNINIRKVKILTGLDDTYHFLNLRVNRQIVGQRGEGVRRRLESGGEEDDALRRDDRPGVDFIKIL